MSTPILSKLLGEKPPLEIAPNADEAFKRVTDLLEAINANHRQDCELAKLRRDLEFTLRIDLSPFVVGGTIRGLLSADFPAHISHQIESHLHAHRSTLHAATLEAVKAQIEEQYSK
jgi:hypothetical protein